MPRALIGLLLLAVVGAGLYAWCIQDPPELPSDPRGQIPGAHPANPGPAIGSHPNAEARSKGSVATTANADPVRIAVPGTTEDARICELLVRVLHHQDGLPLPVPFTEITVNLEADVGVRGLSRTDARGIAQFAFAGGSGETVLARSATGGLATAELSADEPVELTIVVTPRVMATGRVVDQSNLGVAGADIVLLRWSPDGHTPGDLWHIGQSGRNGNFRIPVVYGGRLGATHPDHASSALYLLRPSRSAAAPIKTEVFTLVLPRVSTDVVGTIRDADGRTIADAVIEVQTNTASPTGAELPGPPNRVYSDRFGNFRVAGLPPGDAQWFARKLGHGWNQGQITLLARGDHRLDIRLPQGASLAGIVVDRSTGEPIAGATVVAGTPGTLCNRGTRSAADGRYQLRDLGVARTSVQARLDHRSANTTLELLPGKESTWRAELAGGSRATLRGTVVDSRDLPLADWTVIVRQGDLDPVGMETDGRGQFEMPLEQLTNLDVRVFAPGRQPTSFADLVRRGVDASEPIKLTVHHRVMTAVAGRVLDSSASGAPATIGCWHYEFREYARFTANEDGTFLLQCPVGSVDLTIDHPSHVTHTTGKLELQRGVQADLGTITLARGGGLFGTVMGPGGTPPPACELSLLLAAGPQLPAEYVGGMYRFSNAPAGNHTLIVQGEGIAGVSFPITITAGVDLPRDIEVQQGLHRRVRVVVPPAGGRRVTLAVRASDSSMRWYAVSDVQRDGPGDTGVAVFDTWMGQGSYEAIAVTPEGYEARATLRYQGVAADPMVMRVAPR